VQSRERAVASRRGGIVTVLAAPQHRDALFQRGSCVPILHRRLLGVLESLKVTWEVLLIDDGSIDGTPELLAGMHRSDARFKVIGLSRNFGHQAAVAAGLAYAEGAAVIIIIMDADLLDPPDLLSQCLKLLQDGYEVVFAIRQHRTEGLLLRSAYRVFYRLLRMLANVEIPLDSGEFCLLDRRVVRVLRTVPERNMFLRGMRAWSGFGQIGLAYNREDRAAGSTKYSWAKLVRLAADRLLSFSALPLRLATFIGMGVVLFNVLALMLIVAWRVFEVEFMSHTAPDIPGWAAGLAAMLFLGGVQLLVLGIVGEYIARIYDEVKQPPRWVVRTALGVARSNAGSE
jgi:polyisoprenyl-phosphate glycosyltransferase